MFIIKVTVKDNSFAWNLQRDGLLQCWSLENLYFKSNAIIAIASAKKKK